MVDRASPGGAWHPPRATDWNDIGEATEITLRQQRAGQAAAFRSTSIEPAVIRIKNSSGANRRAGDLLQVDDSLLTAIDPTNLWLDGITPAAPLWQSTHGVLRAATAGGASEGDKGWGPLQIAGAVRAFVNVTDADHYRCDAAASNHVLQSAYAGPWEILYKPSGTGEKTCIVMLGPKRPSSGIVKLSGNLAAGSTGSTTSASGVLQRRNKSTDALESASQTITVRSWFATAFSTNDFLSVAQDDDGDWWMETADCS